MKTGEILSVKEYNKIRYNEWKQRFEKLSNENRHSQRPSILFYLWDKDEGYVLKTERGSKWAKTRKELIIKYLGH